MRVFITGGTGFVGSAVVKELTSAGHQVLALARTEAAAASLSAAGAEAHPGALDDHDSLRRGASGCDGVIHTAFIHDFSNIAASGEVDVRAIGVIGDALAGSARPFVVTSVCGLAGVGRIGTEEDAADANAGAAHRFASEKAALALAERDVRASVVRLPPSVHGDGDYGFVPALIRIARERAGSAYIGDAQNRWPAVHRLDAARLYRLALEKGAPGGRYHAVAEEGIPTKKLAEVIGQQLRLPISSISPEQAAAHFGWLWRFFASDVPSSSALTRERLGWQPQHPELLADLEHGRYFDS